VKRIVLAFLIAPLAPLLVYLIFLPPFLIMGVFATPVAYLVCLVWGIPLYQLIGKREHLNHPAVYILAAGLVGLVTSGIISLFLGGMEASSASVLQIRLFGTIHGAFSGFAFWLITRSNKKRDLLKESSDA
jgi:hypothetical protein